jgi:hypothetical protein
VATAESSSDGSGKLDRRSLGNNLEGRPKGVREVLPRGVARTLRIARQAEKLGIRTDEAIGIITRVMRGDLRGRHLGERLRAACTLLELEMEKVRGPKAVNPGTVVNVIVGVPRLPDEPTGDDDVVDVGGVPRGGSNGDLSSET